MNTLRHLSGTVIILFALGVNTLSAQSPIQKQSMDIFPEAEEGYTQFVIEVPHSDKDNEKKIELFVGKMMSVDNCNTHMLSGTFQENDLSGWGYTYFTFDSDGGVASTMMACPDDEKTERFVKSKSEMVRYNGKLPLVVYVPEGYEVQYKIWKAEDETFKGLEVKKGK